jgi:hypothetical protein
MRCDRVHDNWAGGTLDPVNNMAFRRKIIKGLEIPTDYELEQPFWFGQKPVVFLPKNFEIVFAPEVEMAITGGFGASKTFPSICRATRLSTWYPGNKGIIGRYASTDLASTTQNDCLEFWREANLLEEFTEKGKYKIPTAILKCVNPETQEMLPGKFSEVLFVHMDDPSHFHGHHIGWGWIDEANQTNKKSYIKLVSRVRLPGFEKFYSIWVTSNTDKGKDWIYDHFFDEEAMSRLRREKPDAYRSRRGIRVTTYENRKNLPAGYVENMENSMSAKDRMIHLEGSYDSFEGQIYEEFSENVHCFNLAKCFPQGIPASWNRLLSVDVGGSDPWAFVFSAVDPFGNVLVYDLIYRPGVLVEPFAKEAKPKIGDYRFQAKVIDYENKLAAGELAQHGIVFTNARKQNKNDSIFRLNGYLHPNPEHGYPMWHPKTGETGSPRIFFADNPVMKPMLREIPSQRWLKVRNEDGFKNEPDPSVSDHCLHGDTQVMTPNGYVSIEQLVGTSGLILSHEGWKPYHECRMTRTNAEVVEAVFEDGATVRCTPDHRFLTADGTWIEACALTDEMIYTMSWNASLSTSATSNSMVETTVCTTTNGISAAETAACIVSFGSTITARSQRDTMSITRTMIPRTTRSATLPAFQRDSTYPSTLLSIRTSIGKTSRKLLPPLPNGIDPKQATSGTPSTGSSTWPRSSMRKSQQRVNGVEKTFLSPSYSSAKQKSAHPDATPENAIIPASTTWNANASTAVSHFGATASRIQPTVPRVAPGAPKRCVSVKPWGTANTYCISASAPHSFAIQGGLIVHNSVDALLYALRELPRPTELSTLAVTAQIEKLDPMSKMMHELVAKDKAQEKRRRFNAVMGHGRFCGRQAVRI